MYLRRRGIQLTEAGGRAVKWLSDPWTYQLWHLHRGMWLMYRQHYWPRRNLLVNALVILGIGLRFVYRCVLRILALDRVIARLPMTHQEHRLLGEIPRGG